MNKIKNILKLLWRDFSRWMIQLISIIGACILALGGIACASQVIGVLTFAWWVPPELIFQRDIIPLGVFNPGWGLFGMFEILVGMVLFVIILEAVPNIYRYFVRIWNNAGEEND